MKQTTRHGLIDLLFIAGLFVVMVFAVSQVQAQEPVCNDTNCEVRLSWTLPTENVDDTPILTTGPSALDRVTVGAYLCTDGNELSSQDFTDFPPAQTSALIEYSNAPGTYCFGVYARNSNEVCTPQTNCRWSDQSNVVRRTIVVIPPVIPPDETNPARPNSPTNVTIIVQ